MWRGIVEYDEIDVAAAKGMANGGDQAQARLETGRRLRACRPIEQHTNVEIALAMGAVCTALPNRYAESTFG